MIEARLTSEFQVSALIRAANEFGDSAMVIRKGDLTAGEIFINAFIKGESQRFYAKSPRSKDHIQWEERVLEDIDNKGFFSDYIAKLVKRDPDLWLIELNISDEQRLIRILALND